MAYRRPYRMAVVLALLPLVLAGVSASRAVGVEPPAADAAVERVIDHYLDAGLVERQTPPATQTADETLVRRLALDLIGRIPAAVEVRDYLADESPEKRAALVDRWLGSPEYVEHQATMFNAMIADGEGDLKTYLQAALAENRSWDQVFREIVLADRSGDAGRDAQDFLRRRVRDIDVLANDVSVAFFGVNITCAKCHDHPLVDDWKQDHFYGMKSFFSRTFETGGFVGEREYGQIKFTNTTGTEREAKLMFLTGVVIDEPQRDEPSKDERKREDERLKELAKKKEPPPPPEFSRRAQLVETALAEGQRAMFARAIVNRLWYQYFGQGLVMPLDQMHSANPSPHPELLDALADDLISHGYDLRRLVRGIVMSQAYSRDSRWEGDQRPDAEAFAVAQPKPLTPTQMARSMSLATADTESLASVDDADERAKRIASLAKTQNADLFEQPGVDFQISANEALLLSNSERIEKNYLSGGLVKQLAKIEDARELVTRAVWSVLSRAPSEEEIELLEGYVSTREDRREQACGQLVWALLASSEFRFNH